MCVCVCVCVCVCACMWVGVGGCMHVCVVHTTPITAIYTRLVYKVPTISNLAPLNHGTREEEGEEF